MKRLIFLLFSLASLASCSIDEDSGGLTQDLAPVLSVTLPDSFVKAESYEIEIFYKRPSSCHRFSGFDISKNVNKIFIGVVNSYHTSNTNCSETGNLQDSVKLNFVAERDDFYIFNFWKGKNTLGEDEFLTIEVSVSQSGIE